MSEDGYEDAERVFLREHGKCCICEGTLADDSHVNIAALNYIATWKYPSWNNLFFPERPGCASAYVCDRCFDDPQGKIRFAVEADMSTGKFVLHPLDELEPIEPIDDIELMRREAAMFGFGGLEL